MATIREYLTLSEAVYDASPRVGGWACARMVAAGNGFQDCVFSRANEIVVAYAGTDPTSAGDLFADAQLALGMVPSQSRNALELFEWANARARGRRISLTGHSLGGGLCQVVGYANDVNFVTFNAPPMATNLRQTWVHSLRSVGSRVLSATGVGWAANLAWNAALAKIGQWSVGTIAPDLGLNIRVEWDVVSSSWWGGGHAGRVHVLPTTYFTTDISHLLSTVTKLLDREQALARFDPFGI
ncbi:MAG: hypothetical protein ACFB2Z_11645 [Maricaulaceae bacterium]